MMVSKGVSNTFHDKLGALQRNIAEQSTAQQNTAYYSKIQNKTEKLSSAKRTASELSTVPRHERVWRSVGCPGATEGQNLPRISKET